jgi:hypothetical protein
MKIVFSIVLLLALLAGSFAAVVRTAPGFTFLGAGNKTRTLKSLRGQAVVLVIATSARERAFRRQVRYLEEIYQQFASKQVVFAAALRENDRPIESDMPFVLANNGAAIAAAYGVEDDFQLVIIGRDGNIDYQTDKVATGERVRDVIQNSFIVQAEARKK